MSSVSIESARVATHRWDQSGNVEVENDRAVVEPVNWSALRENCAGDEALQAELLELLSEQLGELMGDIRSAVVARDPSSVQQTANRLKGALASMAAIPAFEAARAVEASANTAHFGDIESKAVKLVGELFRLLEVIDARAAK